QKMQLNPDDLLNIANASGAESHAGAKRSSTLRSAAPDPSNNPKDPWAELALRFTLSFPQVHTAIIGTTNPQNAQDNLAAAAKGPLPHDVVEKIRAAFKHAD